MSKKGIWERSGKQKIKCPYCRQDTLKRPDELIYAIIFNRFPTSKKKVIFFLL